MDVFMRRQRRRVGVPQFLGKIYDILENEEFPTIIGWVEEGDRFVIYDWRQFQEQVLPSYFKHKNFQSFLRQLNMYSFVKRKGKDGSNSFKHKFFKRNQRETLVRIKRRNNGETQEQVEEAFRVQVVQTKEQSSISDEISKQQALLQQQKLGVQLLQQQVQQAMMCNQFMTSRRQQLHYCLQQMVQQAHYQEMMYESQISQLNGGKPITGSPMSQSVKLEDLVQADQKSLQTPLNQQLQESALQSC